MAMAKTIQNGYVPMRPADVSVDDTALDGETAGYTYHEHDRPSGAFELGEDCNAAEIVFAGSDASDGNDFNCKLYGYARSGPAEFLGDISCTIGTARINDVTTALYIDTITVAEQGHIKTLSVSDSGNNRVAKLAFDTIGHKYLYVEFYDVSDTVNALVHTF